MKAAIITTLILFSGVVAVLSQVEPYFICPPPEQVTPCECYKGCEECIATFICSNLTSQDQINEVLTRSGDFPFRVAEFENSALQYIPHEIFEAKQFRRLVIKNCHLTTLIDEGVTGESTLKEMYMSKISFKRGFRFQSYTSLKAMTSLFVGDIEVKRIPDNLTNFFSADMKYLQFENTRTKKVGDRAFAGFSKLDLLVLKKSLLSEVSASWFPQSLTQLVLSENKIKSLPDGFAAALPNLENLFLDGNKLQYLEESKFGKLSKLAFLNLENNPIICDCKMRWVFEKSSIEIAGSCKTPAGKKISEITQNDLSYC